MSHHLHRRSVVAGGLALAAAPAAAPAAVAERLSPIVELRQYTCHPGGRDRLTALFEREFIAPQDALGARVIGIFHDADDPDRFVWLRGFSDMAARREALTRFYSGPVWKTHREAANATMLDSDNVLLLQAAAPAPGFLVNPAPRGEVIAFIHYLDDALTAPFAAFFTDRMAPDIAACGGRLMASFASETASNTYPALPVRERDRVFVAFVGVPTGGTDRFLARWRARSGWRDGAPERLLPAFMRKPEMLRLRPTARSLVA
jgi:hypothetical protein